MTPDSVVKPEFTVKTHWEAITAEIPKVKEERPFDPAYFVISIADEGPVTVCLRCGWMNDTPNTALDAHTDWAERHWMGKHA